MTLFVVVPAGDHHVTVDSDVKDGPTVGLEDVLDAVVPHLGVYDTQTAVVTGGTADTLVPRHGRY